MRQLPGNNSPIEAQDGDTVVLIVKTKGPTVFDPTDEYAYVSQSYRIVADRFGPTLVLVPLSETPVRISRSEVDRMHARALNGLLDNVTKQITEGVELPPIPPCSGRPWSTTTGSANICNVCGFYPCVCTKVKS